MSHHLRVITWNCHRANIDSVLWQYLLNLRPDIALLQEVVAIPEFIKERYSCFGFYAVKKTGAPQSFSTYLLTSGSFKQNILLSSDKEWVNRELKSFSGNLVSREILLKSGLLIRAISDIDANWCNDSPNEIQHNQMGN